jgi:hypothetical protein
MVQRTSWLVVMLGLMCLPVACGGSSGGGHTQDTVTGVSGPDGIPAAYHTGALPAPHGTLTATVPPDASAINGGSFTIAVSSGGAIVAIYVNVQGSDGYYTITIPSGATLADVLITLAQQLPSAVKIVFEVADGAGNVSMPVTVSTMIISVGTGDLQVSVSWNVDNDLDLHVVDPTGVEIYYGDKDPGGTGVLDLDSNASCSPIDGKNNENVTWATGTALAGSYIVRVDNYKNCQLAAAHYVVTVQKAGKAAQTFGGDFLATDLGDSGGAGDGVMVTTFTYP